MKYLLLAALLIPACASKPTLCEVPYVVTSSEDHEAGYCAPACEHLRKLGCSVGWGNAHSQRSCAQLCSQSRAAGIIPEDWPACIQRAVTRQDTSYCGVLCEPILETGQ